MAAQVKIPGVKESNSDRLKKLALPNCHLVEAVLKEHYHIFNEDCRDRLKKLLEVILTVNGGKGKFDKFDENFKRRCIKNLKLRLQSLETAHRKKEEMNKRRYYPSDMGNPGGDHIIKTDDSKEMHVLFKAPSEKHRRNRSPHQDIAECGDHSENEKESYGTAPPESKYDKFLNELVNVQDKSSSVTVREKRSFTNDQAASTLEAQIHDIDKLFAEYKINLSDALDGSPLLLRERKSRLLQNKTKSPEKQSRKFPKDDNKTHTAAGGSNDVKIKSDRRSKEQAKVFDSNVCDDDGGKNRGTGDGVPVKKKKKKHVAFTDPPVALPPGLDKGGKSLAKMGDIPSLAVRYYVALIADMKRNSGLYENFIKEAIKPTENYKQPYIKAAYNCWMEYFTYNMHTLDYLHPYIKDLVRMCKEYRPGHPKMRAYETKLPIVLINGVKNIRPWRRALEETIECCKHLTQEDKKNTVSLNVHQLYVRYHKKIEALKPATSVTVVK